MPRPPNVLWILTTQWRAQATRLAGDVNASTPALDELASVSCNYTQAVTPHPFGPQARAALLTGRPCPDNGVRDYHDPLPLDARTIAHELNDRGYLTAFIGKWHLARRDPDAPLVGESHARTIVPPESRGGFLFWEGFEGGFQLNDPWLHGSRLRHPTRLHGYQSDVLCEWASDWIREETPAWLAPGAPPWFLVLSLEPPHPPYDAPTPTVNRGAPGDIRLRANVPSDLAVEDRARRELAGYYAHIAATDRAIGRLLRAVPPETIVVFTSVHGDMHGSHGLFRKGWPYEESVRIPLLVRGAPGAEAGQQEASAVSLLDLPAMTLAWVEGKRWTCPRAEAAISMPTVVALPDQCDRIWSGVRSATHKRITGADGRPWLEFDLAADPLEQRNQVVS